MAAGLTWSSSWSGGPPLTVIPRLTGEVVGVSGRDTEAASGVQAGGGAAERRRHRRVVALSPLDRDRVARGLPTLEEAEALRRQQTDALTQARERPDGGGEHDNDARLLADVPPHWGNGR